MKQILVIGLYRTGTNYLQQLIEDNLDVIPLSINLKTGHIPNKHAPVEKQLYHYHDDLTIVMVYKNPYKWVDSLVRQSYDLVTEYEVSYETNHTPIYIAYDNPANEFINRPKVKVSLEKLCSLYNTFFDFWETRIHNYEHDVIYHGELIKNPKAYIDHITNKFNLNRKTKEHLEPIEVDGSRCFTNDIRQFYFDEFKTENLTQEQIDCITRNISDDVLSKLGLSKMRSLNP